MSHPILVAFSVALVLCFPCMGFGSAAGVAGGREGVPGYPVLVLLVLAPYLLHVLRTRPVLVCLAALIYVFLVLPLALRQQLPQASTSLMWLPRALVALLMLR